MLSMMDYHAVGSRRGGFEAAVNVALLDERYREAIVDWCLRRGVGHWEEKGREGVAKLLGQIFSVHSSRAVHVLEQLVRIPITSLSTDRLPFRIVYIKDTWKPSCSWRSDITAV